MICPQCGNKIEGRALFCPNCGHKLEDPQKESSANASPKQGQRQGCARTALVLGITLLVVLIIVGVGAAGVYFGLQDRAKMESRIAKQHYEKGLAHLETGNLELAVAEFEHAVALDPENEEAATKLAEARQQLEAAPTPTPRLQQETKAARFEELEAAYAQQDWQHVFETADQLLALDPTYRRGEVDQMLFAAFYQHGLELVQRDRLQEAVRLFDRALELRPGDTRVYHARKLANLYVTAMGYWGADWGAAIESLVALYELDPQYKDAKERLFQAYVNHGDVLAEDKVWCQAKDEYTKALEIKDDAQVRTALEQAATQCTSNPATPAAEGTGTPGATKQPSAPSGTFVGQFVERQSIDRDNIFIRGKVIDKAGDGVAGVQVKIQAWDWSATALTDGQGQYAFDGLSNPVTYTLSLVDVSSLAVEVKGEPGKITWVNFEEIP